ncbi:hypothetical protein QEG73_19255 [Chitinophagaceae bacterium 26-R-25]|nr:hypothetical protein [Chitinophagaceae bacterium 26-R-25]
MITENIHPVWSFVGRIMTLTMFVATLSMFMFCSKNAKQEEPVVQSSVKSTPLYLLDCKRITEAVFKTIDPNDIESITVWKGERAVQKFGAEANNGVIDIRTKKATQPPCLTP